MAEKSYDFVSLTKEFNKRLAELLERRKECRALGRHLEPEDCSSEHYSSRFGPRRLVISVSCKYCLETYERDLTSKERQDFDDFWNNIRNGPSITSLSS